ncbi:hypothetical protein [Pseudomonas sp. RA_35y_Pfl2_P32]
MASPQSAGTWLDKWTWPWTLLGLLTLDLLSSPTTRTVQTALYLSAQAVP